MDDGRPLNSDELGSKGESRFPELCTDAKLKPAKPDRDRSGWDFSVTWPLATGMLLDQRPAPLVCHVQLKTIWAGNDKVTLNLGTLYNIVRDSRPAYVVVLKVDGTTLEFVGMHAIHITGDFLADILRRLRAAQVEGRQGGDVVFQTSVAKWGVRLSAVSGAAFRAAVETDVPSGMIAYAETKNRLLHNLGYEKGRFRFTTVIEANTQDDVVEGFLGLRPLAFKELERFDDRFEMPVSLGRWDATDAVIHIQPTRFDRGIVTIARKRDGRLLQFHGDIFTAPTDVAGPHRVVMDFRHPLFRIRVDLSGTSDDARAKISLVTADDIDGVEETAAIWRDFYTLMAWMVSEPISFELRTRRKKVDPITGTAEPKLNPEKARYLERDARGADIVDWVMLRAGAPGTKMRAKELFEAADDLEVIKTIEQTPDKVSPLGFATPADYLSPDIFEYEMLYLNRVSVGAFDIAYAARTKMKTRSTCDTIAWTGGKLQLAHVRKIKPDAKSFASFADKARRITGVINWVAPSEAQLEPNLPAPAGTGSAPVTLALNVDQSADPSAVKRRSTRRATGSRAKGADRDSR